MSIALIDLPQSVQDAVRYAISKLDPHRVLIFGSQARKDSTASSDFDFAIDLKEGTSQDSWTKFILNVQELPLTLRPIDWINLKEAPLSLKERIIREGVTLYEKAQ